MVHQRGPEVVRPLVDEFFRRCSDIVINHDGIVDHFLGDAVMAFFDVPIRNEDHVARAVRAAAQIQSAIPDINVAAGEEDLLKVGIGIDTGFAATGALGSNDCRDYTVMGENVNIASRLQGEAAPGEILVTEAVYDYVKSAFPNARDRVLELKGIKEPVRAFLLT